MISFSVVIACGLVVLILIVAALGFHFLWTYRKYENLSRGDFTPRVDILMPLRGPDPFLKRCLTALTQQNYPHYTIHIVLDHRDDPVRQIVEQVIADTGTTRLQVEELQDFSETSSLRMNALRQAIRGLPSNWEVLAIVDADAHPDSCWLSDLVAGLRDPKVGIACGLRWYSARDKSAANLTRHVWNTGALLQMVYQSIGWGGSMAFRREAFEAARIYDLWSRALFDDSFASDRILSCGFRLQVVPRVTMINEESTDFKGLLSFISRQMLNIRLYHSSWNAILLQCIVTAVWTILALLTLTVALIQRNWAAAGILAGSFVIYIVVQSVQMLIAEIMVNQSQIRQGKPPIEMTGWRLPCAVILALTIYPLSVWKACRTQSVTWRAITYNFSGPFDVKRLNYQPFVASDADSTVSL